MTQAWHGGHMMIAAMSAFGATAKETAEVTGFTESTVHLYRSPANGREAILEMADEIKLDLLNEIKTLVPEIKHTLRQGLTSHDLEVAHKYLKTAMEFAGKSATDQGPRGGGGISTLINNIVNG